MKNVKRLCIVAMALMLAAAVFVGCAAKQQPENPPKYTIYCGLNDADAGKQVISVEEAQQTARKIAERHEALPYTVAEQVDLLGIYPFDENALSPGEICTVVTDSEGVVQTLEPFHSRKAMLSEQEAISILAEYEEIQSHLAQGMTVLWNGETEEIEGATCLLIAVGTNHAEHFVCEHLYAVSDLGSAYWYDAASDSWSPLGFG